MGRIDLLSVMIGPTWQGGVGGGLDPALSHDIVAVTEAQVAVSRASLCDGPNATKLSLPASRTTLALTMRSKSGATRLRIIMYISLQKRCRGRHTKGK